MPVDGRQQVLRRQRALDRIFTAMVRRPDDLAMAIAPAGHHHRAGSPGAGRVGRQRGITMDNAHFGGVDAEDFMRDLGQRSLKTLAVRMHADPDFEPAIRRHARGGLLVARHHRNAPASIDGSTVRGLLAIDGKADANQPPILFLETLALTP